MQLWKCGRFELPLQQKTYVMGIVNATPDSFSNDGALGEPALEYALGLIEEGADILDIGGESTRPGAAPVSAEEELQRVLPLVRALARETSVPISVDTSKAEVARQALDAGAAIINDISAGTFDPEMFQTLANFDCGVVLMHLRGKPQSMKASTRQSSPTESTRPADLIEEVLEFWQERVECAEAAGIRRERICLDAGFGFGKSLDENLELIRRGRELRELGFPILSGLSRKSTIGKVLGDLPVEERLFGTAAATALAIQNGADIIRVHDVRELAQVARMTDAIYQSKHG